MLEFARCVEGQRLAGGDARPVLTWASAMVDAGIVVLEWSLQRVSFSFGFFQDVRILVGRA
jgi:hypothetical protein